MNIFRRLLAASAAAIIAMTSGVLVAHGDTTPSVYTTPGGQMSQGRLWNTTCEKYSSNTVRCRAEIWATTVEYRLGRYVKRTGWTFNNLSYLPSPRSAWSNNNLGRTNPNWTQSGRQWRTECDTAATGRGGCRSFLLTDVVKPRPGGGYMNARAWVFNNVVLFSSSTIPHVKTVPAWIINQSRLSPTGLGPLQVRTSMADLTTLGYLVSPDPLCGGEGYGESQSLMNRGINVRGALPDGVLDVGVYVAGIRTQDGAQVGMTLAQLKSIYGPRLALEGKYDIPGDVVIRTAVMAEGGNELVFLFDADAGAALVDTDRITMMVGRGKSPNLTYDGC